MKLSQQSKEHFMRRALAESKKALPDCRPNPPVGCLIVAEGKVVSTGYTQRPGQHHAEAQALSKLPPDQGGLIVFSTLEPCSFHGRTPSCALELVARDVQSVIVGMRDPHPRNQGAGLRILRKAGITTECGVLGSEIKDFLEPFLTRDSSA